ncbi:ABC transporter permease subunit [Clostridium sp. YIM B02555]|uniref:ABC transporter permease subunit n=1 Tax=Clostridium sp. YIM B02555 TaxID=2911968 RepID=UPI001EEF5C9A|nr:ABC transporter permease subunit [Clostridium sp. YIM B02555]
MIFKGKNHLINKIVPWILPTFILVAWIVFTGDGAISSKIFPKPEKVLNSFIDLVKSGELFKNILISTERALSGFVVGGGIGFILGFINGLSRKAENFLDSTVQMIRNIPHLALIPLVILWFGIGPEAKLLLISLGVFFPIYLNTFHGIRSIEPQLIEMGKVYGLKGFPLFKEVILPGALPSILVGVKQSLGIMWLTLIVAETVAADSGIGYMAMNARELMLMDIIVLSIIIYALLGKLSDVLAKLLEQRLLRWHPNFKKS